VVDVKLSRIHKLDEPISEKCLQWWIEVGHDELFRDLKSMAKKN